MSNRDKKIEQLDLEKMDPEIMSKAIQEFKQHMAKRPKWQRYSPNKLKYGMKEVVYNYMERHALLTDDSKKE